MFRFYRETVMDLRTRLDRCEQDNRLLQAKLFALLTPEPTTSIQETDLNLLSPKISQAIDAVAADNPAMASHLTHYAREQQLRDADEAEIVEAILNGEELDL